MKSIDVKYKVGDVVAFVCGKDHAEPSAGVVTDVYVSKGGAMFKVKMARGYDFGPYSETHVMSSDEWLIARLNYINQMIREVFGTKTELDRKLAELAGPEKGGAK